MGSYDACFFFGFLRVSEYTAVRTQSFDPESTLCFNNITVNHLIHVKIKSSKTDPFRCGVDIRLAPNGSSLCPVEAHKQFMAIHPTKSGPLFTFQSGRYLRDLYPTCITSVSSHSFRIGAATTAAYMGHPCWLIQKLGRWTSDCFREYIRVPDNTIYSVSKSLVNHPHSAEVYDPDLSYGDIIAEYIYIININTQAVGGGGGGVISGTWLAGGGGGG